MPKEPNIHTSEIYSDLRNEPEYSEPNQSTSDILQKPDFTAVEKSISATAQEFAEPNSDTLTTTEEPDFAEPEPDFAIASEEPNFAEPNVAEVENPVSSTAKEFAEPNSDMVTTTEEPNFTELEPDFVIASEEPNFVEPDVAKVENPVSATAQEFVESNSDTLTTTEEPDFTEPEPNFAIASEEPNFVEPDVAKVENPVSATAQEFVEPNSDTLTTSEEPNFTEPEPEPDFATATEEPNFAEPNIAEPNIADVAEVENPISSTAQEFAELNSDTLTLTEEPDFAEPEPDFATASEEPDFAEPEPDFATASEEPDFAVSEPNFTEPTFEEPNFAEPAVHFTDNANETTSAPTNALLSRFAAIANDPVFLSDGQEEKNTTNEQHEAEKEGEGNKESKGKFYFTFRSAEESQKEDDNTPVLAQDTTIPKLLHTKDVSDKKTEIDIITIALHLQSLYTILYPKCIRGENGVIGRMLQDFASAWETAILSFSEDNIEDNPRNKTAHFVFPPGLPSLPFITGLEDTEILLNEAVKAELYMLNNIPDDSIDKFGNFTIIAGNHINLLQRLIQNFEKITSAKTEIAWLCISCHTSVNDKDCPAECPCCHATGNNFVPIDDYFPYTTCIL